LGRRLAPPTFRSMNFIEKKLIPPTELRVGFIGAGRHSTANLYPAVAVTGIPIVGIAERNPERAREAAIRGYAPRIFVDHHALLSNSRLDGVIVSLAPELQIDVVEYCIRAGVGVYVEKPLGFDADSAQRIAKLTLTQGSPVMRSYDPLDSLPEAAHLRSADWAVASAPAAPQDRRVEMTGHDVIDSQLSLCGAARGAPVHTPPEGKEYALRTDAPLAVVVTCPGGWHLAERHIEQGQGPHYCLPRVESPLEARVWNGIFAIAQDELRDHASAVTLPGRADISMTACFMPARTELLVKACHHRNAFATGGMAAVIPNRPEPGVSAAQPLDTASAPGRVTEAGLRSTLYVAISYVAVWLSGSGAVAIPNLMEDDATAELRAQVEDDASTAHYGSASTLSADFFTIPDYELVIQ
jgi:hypothetical protein